MLSLILIAVIAYIAVAVSRKHGRKEYNAHTVERSTYFTARLREGHSEIDSMLLADQDVFAARKAAPAPARRRWTVPVDEQARDAQFRAEQAEARAQAGPML